MLGLTSTGDLAFFFGFLLPLLDLEGPADSSMSSLSAKKLSASACTAISELSQTACDQSIPPCNLLDASA